jgi:hypothetical protein
VTTPDPTSDTPPEVTMDNSAAQFRQSYDELLSDAVKVLTAAARLSWTLRAPDGSVNTGPCDWAEFVTLALAGATANIGSLEAILAGRPGSWEADGVRNLLNATVGDDLQQLLEHRAEPLVVNIIVDDILFDLGVFQAYEDASTALEGRYEALDVPSQTCAPGAAPEHHERRLNEIGALEDKLAEQRRQDWAAYGGALKSHIEAQAVHIEGLRVPVLAVVDLGWAPGNCDTGLWGSGPDESLADSLLNAAIAATPLPGNGKPPLERLTNHAD